MRHTALLCTCLLALILDTPAAQAEEIPSTDPRDQCNPHSVYKIPRSHIIFKQRVWREIHCQEPRNRPFFAKGREITKVIIEGVKKGHLTPYKDEAFEEAMKPAEFWEKLKYPEDGAAEDKAAGFDQDDDWGDAGEKEPTKSADEHDYFLPSEVSVLELMEDRIYAEFRGEHTWDGKPVIGMLNDMLGLWLIIPAKKFETGLRREVAIFKFKDLYEYFRKLGDDAVWVNDNNSARHLNLAEAFERRLFDSRVVKLENNEDATLEDIYKEKHLEVARHFEIRFVEQECGFGEP